MILAALLALAASPDPAGEWVTQDRSAVVRFGACGGSYCARIARVLRRNAPASDVNNPDRAQRGRPLVGVPVLSGFGPGGSGQGRAYDPRTGRSYRARLRLNPDGTLRVTGCVMMFCRSQIWTRR